LVWVKIVVSSLGWAGDTRGVGTLYTQTFQDWERERKEKALNLYLAGKKKKMFMLNFESLKHFIGHGLHVKGRTHIGGIGIGRKPKT
jgi:hypothetical protein